MHFDTRQARDTIRYVGGEYATLRRSCRTPPQIMRHLWLLLDLLEQTVSDLERSQAAWALFGAGAGTPVDELRKLLPAGFELVRVHPANERLPHG
jgi:hypothetical protein